MNIKKTIILFFLCLLFLAFIFFTYFYWTPDSLIEFLGDKGFFYLHLNLNKFSYSGKLTNKWIISEKVNNVLEKISKSNSIFSIIGENINKKNLSALDQASVVLLNSSENNLGVVLLLKIKKGADILPIFKNAKKIAKDIIVIETEPGLYKKPTQIKRKIKNNLLNFFVIGNGFLDISKITNKKTNGFGDFVDFNLMHSLKDVSIKELLKAHNKDVSNELCFLINSFDSDIYSNFFEFKDFSKNNIKTNFVFVFPENVKLNHLIKQAKTQLAYSFPSIKKVSLPDGSIFFENIADLTQFNFKNEKIGIKEFYYYQEKPEQDIKTSNIIFLKTSNNVLFSNNFNFIEKLKLSDLINKTIINKAIVLEIKDIGILGIRLLENKKDEFSGCFIFED